MTDERVVAPIPLEPPRRPLTLSPTAVAMRLRELAARTPQELASSLHSLAWTVEHETEDSPWLRIDLFQAFAVDDLDGSVSGRSWLPYAEMLRNVLALLPLLVTWVGLTRAFVNYHLLKGGSLLALPPFTALLPWLTRIALLDSILLTVLLATTIVTQVAASRGDRLLAELRLAIRAAAVCLSARSLSSRSRPGETRSATSSDNAS